MTKTRPAPCTIFIRDMHIKARLGLYPAEMKKVQDICIQFEATYTPKTGKNSDEAAPLSYEEAAREIRAIIAKKHYKLVETLAQEIFNAFKKDKRVKTMSVTIEKLKPYSPTAGLFKSVGSVGITLLWQR